MVPEPAGSAVQSVVAGIAAAILSLTGITYFSMLWSFIGVIAALVFLEPKIDTSKNSNTKAIMTVFVATMVGAGLAELVHSMLITSTLIGKDSATGVQIGIALMLGAGAKPALVAGIGRMVRLVGGQREA